MSETKARHPRRRHHHHERPDMGGPPFGMHGKGYPGGPGAWFGPPWARGRRARRGDVRTALLAVLAEQPMHGYDIIRDLDERSGGMWRPSPGSIYPTLQMLEDEGLVASEERDGKRVYSITEAGRAEVEERRKRGGGDRWDVGAPGEGFVGLRDAVFQLGAAAMQVAQAGSAEQVERAKRIVADARRGLYRILAEEPEA